MDRRTFTKTVVGALAAIPFLGLLKEELNSDYLYVARRVLPPKEIGELSVCERIEGSSMYTMPVPRRLDELKKGDRFYFLNAKGYDRENGEKRLWIATSDHRKVDGPERGVLEVEPA